MASLLTIAQELREKIIQCVLTSDILDPVDLNQLARLASNRSELSKDELKSDRGNVVRSWTGAQYLLFEPFQPSLHPLFLVNRKISSDASLVLARIKVDYHLDVILVNEVLLFPTWLMIPRPAFKLDTLTCDFRIASSSEIKEGGPNYKGFRMGDGAGPAIAWVIYGLLELFLLHGPSFGKPSSYNPGAQNPDYIINSLVINIKTPPGIDPSRFGKPLTGYSSRRRTGVVDTQGHVLEPKYLLDFIRNEISSLLCMSYHTAEYGDILYKHIGKIIIELDGETEIIQNLSKILKELKPNFDDASTSQKPRVQAFHDWKARAMARRSRLGLGFANDVVDTTLEYKSYRNCYPTGGLYG